MVSRYHSVCMFKNIIFVVIIQVDEGQTIAVLLSRIDCDWTLAFRETWNLSILLCIHD